MKAGFDDFKDLMFISLVHVNKFQNLACQVNKDALESLEKIFENYFYGIKLKTDYAATYNA